MWACADAKGKTPDGQSFVDAAEKAEIKKLLQARSWYARARARVGGRRGLREGDTIVPPPPV